jgi:hypothetical protein
MSVRIDNDFWKNFSNHKELLTKCFTHLYHKKYPVNEGPDSAFNFLVYEFFRKGIFERFDAEREGKLTQTKMKNKTSQKKFEQYIYKWAESVMYGLYHNERKHRERYLRFSSDKIEILTEQSYNEFKENTGISSWDVTTGGEKQKVVTKRKSNPSISDARDYRGETPASADEAYRTKQVDSFIQSVLKSDRERTIVSGKKDGLPNTTIAEMVGVTSSQVANIIDSIRSRCSSVLA